MAVDEALLQTAADHGHPTLRFYRWRPATLSLGYFQRLADRRLHPSSSDCEVVRRASGGGAIVHDRELTYCLATPARDRFMAATQLYLAFHQTLVAVLADLGITAMLYQGPPRRRDDAFLCFQRRSAGDVTVGDHKIAGSAQRRWRNAVVQHGGILLGKSRYAPELPGLAELTGFREPQRSFQDAWLRRLSKRLNIAFQRSELSDKEQQNTTRLAAEKFAQDKWNARR